MQMTPRDWTMLILLSVLWGGAFFFSGYAIREVPPLTVVFVRVGLGALTLLVVLTLTGETWPTARGVIPAFLGMGFLNNVIPFSLLFWAQTVIPGGLASILNATTPIFAILVAQAVLPDEKLTANKLAGVVLGLIGVAVLVGSSVWTGEGRAVLGMIASVVAAVSYGGAIVFARRFKTMGVTPPMLALGQLTATSTMMLPVILIVDRPWTLAAPSGWTMAALLCLAVFSTALAYILYFRILANAGAVNASLVTILIPGSAILLGAAFLGERLEGRHFAGMALILLGLVVIDGRPLARLMRRPA